MDRVSSKLHQGLRVYDIGLKVKLGFRVSAMELWSYRFIDYRIVGLWSYGVRVMIRVVVGVMVFGF